jgi:hypothetical protein
LRTNYRNAAIFIFSTFLVSLVSVVLSVLWLLFNGSTLYCLVIVEFFVQLIFASVVAGFVTYGLIRTLPPSKDKTD